MENGSLKIQIRERMRNQRNPSGSVNVRSEERTSIDTTNACGNVAETRIHDIF